MARAAGVRFAVGAAYRLPRRYWGRDILAWFDAMGILERADIGAEPQPRAGSLPAAHREPESRTLDLGVLQDMGVRLVGRATDVSVGRIRFADDLNRSVTMADVKLSRLLAEIDAFILKSGLEGAPEADPIRAVVPAKAPKSLEAGLPGIRTVVWATGYRRSYPWLRVPVLDERGEIRHEGGITASPGLYVWGCIAEAANSTSWTGRMTLTWPGTWSRPGSRAAGAAERGKGHEYELEAPTTMMR
jgi:putative flavoprotein involved in K+ transport